MIDRPSVRISLVWDSRNKLWRVWATATPTKGRPRVLGTHKIAHSTVEVDSATAQALVWAIVAELERRLL